MYASIVIKYCKTDPSVPMFLFICIVFLPASSNLTSKEDALRSERKSALDRNKILPARQKIARARNLRSSIENLCPTKGIIRMAFVPEGYFDRKLVTMKWELQGS